MKSFQNSRLILLLQSGSLVFLSVLLGILLMKSLWFCSLFTFFVILLFILHIDKQQQKLTEMVMRLITAIRFSDFSLSFRPGSKKQADPRLTQAMEQALKQFREKMYTLEEQHLYYNTLLSTIDSGILVLNRNGTIEWYNKTVLREFGLTSLRQLSELAAITPDLPDLLLRLIPGETHILRLEQSGRVREIALNPVIFRIQGKELLLISLKNIHSVLENNEIEAWQKLIRVLTHEIMNAVTPITSLSDTLLKLTGARISKEEMRHGLQTISATGKGLLAFVESYRRFTRIPTPEPSLFYLKGFINRMAELARHQYPDTPVTFNVSIVPDDLILYADENLISQVIINLLKNAIQAFETGATAATGTNAETTAETNAATTEKHINIRAYCNEAEAVLIEISNNGPAIPPDIAGHIFIPFFTTKENGSGIGLSISRQIMRLSGGSLSLIAGKETTFVLKFN